MRSDSIVILHGWGGQLSRWRLLKNQLEAAGYRVFLPRLPQDKARNTADYSRWLLAQTKNYKPFFLLAHSFGGQIAIDFTAAHPDRVKKLILVASAGLRRPSLKSRLALLPAKLLKGLVSDQVKFWLYRLVRETDYIKATPIMRQTMKLILKEDQQENLKKIIVPTLLLWGRRDRYTPIASGRKMQRLIAGSQLIEIPTGRHGLPFSHAATLAEKILWFIGWK